MPLSRLTGFALTAAMAWVPFAAPVHVHESRDHAAHHRVVMHRHSEAHGASHHGANHHGVFEESDAQVRTLSSVFVIPNAALGPSAPPVQAVPRIEVQVIQAPHPIADYVELLIHGPPRAPVFFRGPPTSPAL